MYAVYTTESSYWLFPLYALCIYNICTLYILQNPHTGFSLTSSIAAAAISNEDASQLQRMQDRGQQIIVSLYMDNELQEPTQSRNLLIDLVGSELPDEYGVYIVYILSYSVYIII